MCYRCQGFGHSMRDCYLPEARSDARTCVRCGQPSCKAGGQGDWYRFMEGCNRTYSKSDLKHVRCFVCGKTGHFCCKPTPEVREIPRCRARVGHVLLSYMCSRNTALFQSLRNVFAVCITATELPVLKTDTRLMMCNTPTIPAGAS